MHRLTLSGVRSACYIAIATAACAGSHAAHAASTAPASPGPTVELDEIRVDGNTTLPPGDIEQAVYPFLGPNKTAVDVEHARAALLALYQRRGLQTVAVVIPPQRVTDGIVYLKVVEQRVERLRVVGATYVQPSVLKRQAPSVKPGRVPDMNALKRDVQVLNTMPDRTVTPAFRPGRAPNTVDVDLNVQDALPLHGSLELNNRRSVDTTPLRLSGSLTYDDFMQRGDTGTVFFQVAPQNTADARVVGGSYLFHIPSTALALLLSYSNSDSDVSTVGNTDVVGKGQILSLRLQVPLGLTDGFVHSLSAGIDYKKIDERVQLGGTATRAPITYYPLTVDYQADWVGAHSQTDLNAEIVAGLRGAGGSQQPQFDNKRFDARQDFAYARATLSRLQTLPHDIQLYGNLSAQASTNALVSSEQLSLGGLDTVRGYLESEALGDQGVALQAELRSPSIAGLLGKRVDMWRFHAFADIGNVSIHNAYQQATSYTLSSVGVGTRIQLFSYLSATLEDAVLLSRGATSRSGSNRVLFRVTGSF